MTEDSPTVVINDEQYTITDISLDDVSDERDDDDGWHVGQTEYEFSIEIPIEDMSTDELSHLARLFGFPLLDIGDGKKRPITNVENNE